MMRPRKDFWDDKETTAEDIGRGTANRAQVLKELILHALSTEPLDASRVARWHKDCFSGLSHVSEHDECLLGAYRGTRHPCLRKLRVSVGGTYGVAPHEVKEELVKFFGQLQKRMSGLAARIRVDQDKSKEEHTGDTPAPRRSRPTFPASAV